MACIGLISVNVNAQSQNWWRVNGNTPSSSDFLGTSNSSDLIFKTNNQTRFVIDAVGNFKVNALAGAGKQLLFSDNSGKITPYPLGSSGQYLDGTGTWQNIPASANSFTLNGNQLYTAPGTLFGIGTNNPQYSLDVAGNARVQNNLIVGGGVIITDKVHAAITVTASTLRADSLMLNSTKGIYGTTNINGDVFANNKLTVSGNAVFGGNLKVAGLSGTVTSNVYIDASGNLQRGAPINSSWACASTPNWNLGGNNFGSAAYVGVTDANIGTCDAYDFILKSFNTNRAWFQTDGTMSFGARITSNTGGPEFRVYQAAVRLSGSNTFGGPMLVLGGPTSPYGDWGMEYTGGTSASQAGLNFWKPYASSNANNNILFLRDNNRVGIGTDNPSARLTIDAWTDDGLLVKCDNSGNPATVKNAIDVYDKTNNIVQFRVKSNGVVYSREVNVALSIFPDYVFKDTYKLLPLDKLETFIKNNKHLPNVPSASEIKENGANLGELCRIQMEKIEELTLYVIELKKEISEIKKKINN